MMELEFGNIVLSLAGHDKGEYFVVIDVDDEYVYLADGRIRKIASPKRKKKKHVKLMPYECEKLVQERTKSGKITDEMVKWELKRYDRRQICQNLM